MSTLTPPAPPPAEEAPPPAPELFSQEQLEAHATALARAHRLAPATTGGRPLLARVAQTAAAIERVHQFLSDAARDDPRQVGSEDWLRDNHHVALEQVREIRQDLPRRFYDELPKLADGPWSGYPRVYLIARELVAHTAGRFDLAILADFTRAYQQVAPLSIGETWAVPIMLRVALVEELGRLAEGVAAARRHRQQAVRWAAGLARHGAPGEDADWAPLAEMRVRGRLSAPFVVELLQWLRDQPASAAPAWRALQRALEAQGDTPEQMLRLEHQREAADQLAIGNAIGSMRLLSSIDWPLFFDRVSLVEQILRDDPAGAYAEMNFATRDRYRHSVEQLARRSGQSELAVARRVVTCAREGGRAEPDVESRRHVGYYLISRGRAELERELGYRPTAGERMARFAFRHPVLGYLGTLGAFTTVAVAALLSNAAERGASPGMLGLVALLTVVPASELALSLLNLLVTSHVPPRHLPKLELRHGIPARDRTMVVVPALIDSLERVDRLVDDLVVRFFGNRDEHLHFALLTDFADADSPTRDDDAVLLEAASRRVDALNAQYGADRFYLFHRERRWNPRESRWMGWERKRGKLAEFNRLLRGATDTSFAIQHGDLRVLPSVRYVITLDSDTQLPIHAARELVGALAHPLNRPRVDPARQRVTEGYGVLQPRVAVNLASANRTLFARVFSGHVGLDPYTTAVSDVYQDLFHEGSFVGKGIYDVDAFEAALAGRVPENALLSHDLFEGLYARAGLVTDVQLVDDYPAHYLTFTARQHRWVRGDWQIVRWLWPTVPDASGRPVANTLPAIARWKIADNLRRSLLAPALVALLVAGWTVLPGSVWLWTGLALLVLAFPAYAQLARSLGSHIHGVPIREHIAAERAHIVTSLRQALLSIALLAHQAVVTADAIVRAIWRMTVTRRGLLEWVTADRVEVQRGSMATAFRRMWPAPLIALAAAALIVWLAPARLAAAAPILLLWALSPGLAHAASLPLAEIRATFSRVDRAAFRRIALRTWRFFDELVTADDHWLVPDNYQEDRRDVVAHRTSPTNIGLQLLSTLAAHDFGYVTTTGVLGRLEPTFRTLLGLPRYRGHFYNWYDTRSLVALSPAYVSTVDSGNLAGYLLTLRAGLGQLVEETPLVGGSALEAIDDRLALCEESLAGMADVRLARRARAELARLRALTADVPVSLADWRRRFARIRELLSALGLLFQDAGDAAPAATDAHAALAEAEDWLARVDTAVEERLRELEALAGWMDLMPAEAPDQTFAGVPSLAGLVRWCDDALVRLSEDADAARREAVSRARQHADQLIGRADRLAALADDLVEETEFGFLFNPERQIFSIGFNVSEGRLDDSHYDMLASEARLASFVAIATDKIPHDHWFKLGRSLTRSGTTRALVSWSASMFEYLMPLIVMRAHPGTLLDETYRAVVERQRQYGAQRGVPWGISESAYLAQDLEGNYQYRAFGVPGLGLKRGLADDLVVAPYATMLAAPLAPVEALRNLERLRGEGMTGAFGFYEAIDYTPERQPADRPGRGVPLPTYMAHHQGMTLVSLDNLLHGDPMPARFHADPRVQAADLLLQERVPHLVPLRQVPVERVEHVPAGRRVGAPLARHYLTPHTTTPRTHLLSNGSCAVMVTNAGGGVTRRQGLALTRWREDVSTDRWGTFIYVRDLESGEVWSTTHQPVGRAAAEYEVTFAPDRAIFRRVDGTLEIRTEVAVSPEDDAELRRVSITNHGDGTRHLELTSYAEVVLAPEAADLAHPAFSNLFVETSIIPERDAIVCSRRPRAGGDRVYLVHVLGGRARVGPPTQFETDRARFVGRGRTLQAPAALDPGARLTGTTGAVLDPIVSVRQSVHLPPGGTARVSFTTAFAETVEGARRLAEKYHDRRAVARALALASTHSEIERRHLGLSVDETLHFHRLAGRLIYNDPRLRSPEAVRKNRLGRPELWKYGISGDLPIALVRVREDAELALVRDLLKAHEYLRVKGLLFDLVVLNEHGASYLQTLDDALRQMVESGPEQGWIDKPGGVFLRRADLMSREDQVLLEASARAVMDGAHGRLLAQLARPQSLFATLPPDRRERPASTAAPPPPAAAGGAPLGDGGLELFNGLGGFADDGREYVVHVHPNAGRIPPAPWSNVVAHASFGFAATELGTGFTWSENSHDNRLTPWSNDPVIDPPGEAVFIRDDDSGQVWSATPLPAGGGRPYTVRHGQGYTVWEHERDGIGSSLRAFVPMGEAVKVFALTLRNDSGRPRACTVTIYAEWVLEEHRSRSALHIVTSREPSTGAVLARNAVRDSFADRVAFLDLWPGDARTITGDRLEFLGRNGRLGRPAALAREALSDRTGAALDPCGAVQVRVTLGPSEERTLVGLLGEAGDADGARTLVQRYRDAAAVEAAWQGVRAFWEGALGAITVRTPDRSFDLLLNRWLPYQTLACRIWGRSAFYQSSGAFGFRDQLQDALAVRHTLPELTRAQILRAASRQFVEGDVQHWWHEPGGQGVRTRFSDDRLWLVYATLEYVAATGDAAVLDELIPFLEERLLAEGEHEAYTRPQVSTDRGTLYEHCVRAVARSLDVGSHGLPLMGTGDWNDGMSLVGAEGRGESVWVGWFLVSLLRPFADLAAARGEPDRADGYRRHAARLTEALEQAWDGAWYRRAYFDDGTPLGSRENEECRIDAIAQSWAVISGAADPAHARQAMASVEDQLVRRDDGLILLLTPPFDRMTPSPGYIQGYVPGVRENGGQYTHAALWTILAFARLGDGDKAAELFALINPITRTRTPDAVARYRAEPYVVAADVYSNPAHVGRGGWTWYTGSAGWMHRVGLEGILGLTPREGGLHVDPCIPRAWPGFEATFRRGAAEYRIAVDNSAGAGRGVRRIEVDGAPLDGQVVPLTDDGRAHDVRVVLG